MSPNANKMHKCDLTLVVGQWNFRQTLAETDEKPIEKTIQTDILELNFPEFHSWRA